MKLNGVLTIVMLVICSTLSAQSTSEQPLDSSYVSLTAEELESLLSQAVKRQQALNRKAAEQRLAYYHYQRDRANRQASATPPPAPLPRIAPPVQSLSLSVDSAAIYRQRMIDMQASLERLQAQPDTTVIRAMGTDPRVDYLEAELAQLRRRLEPTTFAEDPTRALDLVDYSERNQLAERRAELELDRLRREGKLDKKNYDRQRKLLRAQARLAEQQALANTPPPTVVTPPTTTPRPAVIPVPYSLPGGRDTIVVERVTAADDSALRAEIRALRDAINGLNRPAPVVAVPSAPVVIDKTKNTTTVKAARIDNFPPILFANNSEVISDTYLSVVAAVADAYRKGRTEDIEVVGYASATGNMEYNQQLSKRRAERVRQALVAAGIPSQSIRTIYAGINYQFTDPAAARRVEIRSVVTPE